MNSKLFIAEKIKVGFNPRQDTYTGMLGYVIGHDGKKWRKEPSWEGWRYNFMDESIYEKHKVEQYALREKSLREYKHYNTKEPYTEEEVKYYLGTYEDFRPNLGRVSSDPKINPVEYDNIPTEGFVLNKKAGGYSTGWNHRSTYCRVYDPRGFEFEISIPNLLFILQECNAYKGKGLEGSFVYAWDGKDLVLLPASCDEYTQSTNFTKLQSGKVGVKDLVPGCTYKTKQMEEYIYLGKFNWFIGTYNHKGKNEAINIKKQHTFCRVEKSKYDNRFLGVTSLSSFVQRVTEIPVSNYADLLDEFNSSTYSGVLTDIVVDDYKPDETMPYYRYGRNPDIINEIVMPIGDNKYEIYEVVGIPNDSWRNRHGEVQIQKYSLSTSKVVVLKENDFDIKSISPKTIETISKNDLEKMKFKILKINKNNKEKQIQF